uniref:cytochrome c553 n=1 Tax=Sargassum macrocarpum TaxID=74092 RepID=UPI0021B4F8C0|nr:cytochrome c553 [Sargassum macrocarpum]YP_010485448.1 cytochrome c553 [Sargassum serratifolium]UVW81242.1 cytochrome c553 [Sargassum macrocarpum]UVW81381.1 cytochrome c553 [Sargassum serratifolium]
MKNFFFGLFIPYITVILFCTPVQAVDTKQAVDIKKPVDIKHAVDINHGENVFTANCSACHAGGNNVIMPEKTLQKDALSINQMNSVGAITYQVTNGKNAMPAFGGRLSDDDIEDVASFVLSRSEKSWD